MGVELWARPRTCPWHPASSFMFYIHTWDFNQERSLHGLGTRWGSCWGEFMKICVVFSLMSLTPKEVHDLTNFRGPDEKARLVSSQVGCVCNWGSKEVILLSCPMFQKTC